nr:hypothetical protein [Tanacetum cinerariifolium]
MTEAVKKSITKDYITKAQDDYYSGITKTMINRKTTYELKVKFLDDFQNNAFSETNKEEAVEHIENFLKVVDPLILPNKDDGYCNGGNLPGIFRVGNTLHYQDLKCFEDFEDGKLKEEALKNKAFMKGLIDEDDESYDKSCWHPDRHLQHTMLLVNAVGNKMHKAFPLPGESSHWQYKFPLPVEGVPTARSMEIPLPGVYTAMMKKLPVKENWQLH